MEERLDDSMKEGKETWEGMTGGGAGGGAGRRRYCTGKSPCRNSGKFLSHGSVFPRPGVLVRGLNGMKTCAGVRL